MKMLAPRGRRQARVPRSVGFQLSAVSVNVAGVRTRSGIRRHRSDPKPGTQLTGALA